MARPAKQTVDYFPHIIKNGKTITILENKFGNDGYAFWFKLLEILGSTEGHFYEYTNTTDKEFLHARTLVSEETAKEILDLLADLNAIDPELWQENIIWSDNFVDNIEDAYSRRKVNVPQKPTTKEVNDNINESEEGLSEVSDNTNPQSKVNKKRVKKHIDEVEEIIDTWTSLLSDVHKPTGTKKQREAIITKLKKWNKEKIIKAIKNYNEIYRSGYYYSHNWTMYKFIKQGNGAPRFLPGLDQEEDGDIWKDYQSSNYVMPESVSKEEVAKHIEDIC